MPCDPREVTWGLKDIGKLLGLYLLGLIFVGFTLSNFLWSRLGFHGTDLDKLAPLTGHWLSIALVFYTHTRYRRWPNASYFGLTREDFRTTWKQGFCWGVEIIASIIPLLVLRYLFSNEVGRFLIATDQDAVGSLIWYLGAAGSIVVAPLSEELFFRGIIQGWVSSKYGLVIGRVVSSLLFAVAHGRPTMIPLFFIIGLYYAYLYEHTKTLAPLVIAHSTYNLLVVVLSVILP